MKLLRSTREKLRAAPLQRRLGWVRRVQGLAIETEGPAGAIGEMCRIETPGGGPSMLAEVVGVRPGCLTLMAYGDLQGLAAGATVVALGASARVPAGDRALGRVIDPFGAPLDGKGPLPAGTHWPLHAPAANPLTRPPVCRVLETGMRAVDALLTLGRGQRIGIFAGSGVGKSVLLGMMARHVAAAVNVVALVGERGREVREFVDKHLGPEGLARSVVIVATAEQPALARVRAAHAAVAIAQGFGEAGRDVLLTIDSMTRLAMARREIGLAAGEPATARGYTPSVFAELPQLCERCGTCARGGSVTALLTVLVEGDDLQDPVADSLRSILDGHLVLSRELAQQGHFPAIDVLRSVSRLHADLAGEGARDLATRASGALALLERHRQLVDIGAYQSGSNAALDAALSIEPALLAWLRQAVGGIARAEALQSLAAALGGGTMP